MTDYSSFDAALIAKIGAGATSFAAIHEGDLARQARALAQSTNSEARYGMRVVDRRLQALRKAGKLTFSRATGWRTA